MSEKFSGPLLSRKGFLYGVAGSAALVALGGGAAFAGSAQVVRPPGCVSEESLLAACIRCDRCRGACPHDAIVIASPEDGIVSMRTPKLDFHQGYCDFCGAKQDEGSRPRCVQACPTGALAERPWADEVIGVAIIDPQECIAYTNYAGCTVCVDVCPYEAVFLDGDGLPVVDANACNGCGYCEYRCPSHSYRSFSGSAHRGIYVVKSTAEGAAS